MPALPKLALGALLAAGIGVPLASFAVGSPGPDPEPTAAVETENPVVAEQRRWWEEHGYPQGDEDDPGGTTAETEWEPDEPITELTLPDAAAPAKGERRIATVPPRTGSLTLSTKPAVPGDLRVEFDCIGAGRVVYGLDAVFSSKWDCADGETDPVAHSLSNMIEAPGPLRLTVRADPGVRWTIVVLSCPRAAPCAKG